MTSIDDILSIEIVRELLTEVNPNITDAEVNDIWSKCGGNPWNAQILYKLLSLRNTD
jgi:hypothetical protein